MFLSTYRPLSALSRLADPFEDDFFGNFFGNEDFFETKENRLKKDIARLKSQENEIDRHIKHYEASIEELKKTQEEIQKKKATLAEKLQKATEEQKKIDAAEAAEASKNGSENNHKHKNSSSKVVKKVFYSTPEMEVEEQYDSTDPKKCYKVIRKPGQPPQVISGDQAAAIHDEKKSTTTTASTLPPLGEGLDAKLSQLTKLAGKESEELRTLVAENKDLTVGQLFDKATEKKLI